MQQLQQFRRLSLTLCLLSACAASDLPGQDAGDRSGSLVATGAPGAFLAGRFAAQHGDLDVAADEFLRALAHEPDQPELSQQAFLTALLTGRPEALTLAEAQPDSPAAQLLLADRDVRAGAWDRAEQRFAALPHQGLTQLLQPLLVAWAQAGAGHPETALATLRPFIEAERFRAVYALHGALIADLADRPGDAARLYRTAQVEYGGVNLQLGRMVASWQARTGHGDAADQTLQTAAAANEDLALALPAVRADAEKRQVRTAADGIAEAYLALAAALHTQDASEFAIILLRLALDLRPDLTAARLLAAEIADGGGRHPESALVWLEPVRADDPLAGLVHLRRAGLLDRIGQSEEALRLLQALAAAHPDRPEPWLIEGQILRGKHRDQDAVAAYDAAAERLSKPGRADWVLFYQRAVALERAHNWPRAEADLEHALTLSPDQPMVMNYLGYSWTEQGRNLPRARQLIERAVEQRPNDGAIVDSLGWITLKQGDVPAAVKWLEKAVELEPEDPSLNYHLGEAYLAAGRKLEAQYQWRRALTLNPEPDEAARAEARLRGVEPAPATAEKVVPIQR